MRTRVLGALFSLVALVACSGSPPTAHTPATRTAAFDRYWSAFDEIYPAFALKGVDWSAQRSAFRPRAAAAPSTAALVELLREMVTPLIDGHVTFTRPDGSVLSTWTPTTVVNWDRTQWLASWPTLGYTQVKPNLGYALLGDIGYVVIGGWNPSQFSAADVDAVFDRFQGSAGLILDIRMNGGGDDRLAFAAAGRFLALPRSAGTVRYRNGPAATDLGPAIDVIVSPRGTRLTMPVVLLTGRGVYSSSESFVEVMRQEVSVTTVGDTTGGSSGNPTQRELADGWQFSVPRWVHRTVDGALIEGHGIPPEVFSAWDPAAARAGRDVVLEAALARWGGNR